MANYHSTGKGGWFFNHIYEEAFSLEICTLLGFSLTGRLLPGPPGPPGPPEPPIIIGVII